MGKAKLKGGILKGKARFTKKSDWARFWQGQIEKDYFERSLVFWARSDSQRKLVGLGFGKA